VRLPALALAAALTLTSATAEERAPARRLPALERYHYGCVTGDQTYRLIATDAALRAFTALLVEQCKVDEKAFSAALAASRIDFRHDAIVLIELFYGGTGMAKASLALPAPVDGILTADITITVPPPPLTPDTARFPFAFAVSKAAVGEVVVTVGGAKKASLPVDESECH
jgi:hypothetical protein